jgi:tetratricopeptide (TPR) repeat protein
MNTASWTAIGLLVMGGCGKHPGSYSAAGGAAAAEAPTIVAQADALWAQRVDEAKLTEAITTYEKALAEEGPSRHVLGRLVRGWYFWGDAFTTDKEVQIERWGKAIEYGTQCLALNDAFRTSIEGGAKEKDAVVSATAEDVPCLYWTASSLGKWGRAMGIARTLKHLPTVKAYMSRIEELEPTYYNNGPARYWGAYYAALPSFAGQDYALSAEYFEKSIAGSPHYLPTRVLRAADHSVPLGDVKQFDADLLYVLAANPNERPDADVMPENVRDQQKARDLFARRGELFDKKVLAEAGPAPAAPAPYQPPAMEATAPDAGSPAAAPDAGAGTPKE